MNQKTLAIFAIIFVTLITILYIHSVKNKFTNDDYEYIPKFLDNIIKISKESSYMEELEFINSVQKSVLKVAPSAGSIPLNKPREPKDVYIAQYAGCSERSRVLLKIFKYYGFETRQFSMYSKEKSNSSILVLLTPRVRSHAAIEVLTKKGWLVVDPNHPWISIDALNNPLSINKIKHDIDNSVYIDWKVPPADYSSFKGSPHWKDFPADEIYLDSFIYVYGLYSRHGRYYPPFNFIPDVNYGELIQNVFKI